MKITITKQEMKMLSAGLAKIIPPRANIQVLTCVRFAIEDKTLTASGTDLDQTAKFWFDNAKTEGAGEILIPFSLIRDLSKGEAGDTVTLENEGMEVTVTDNMGGHVITRTVECHDPADWPPQGEPIPVGEAKGFLDAYRRLAPFASTDPTRRIISSIHVDIDADRNATLVATDGKRLTCCNSMRLPNVDNSGVILPVSKFLLWTGLPGDARIGVLKSKTHTQFGLTSGQWSYRTLGIDGVYPNWRQVVPKLDEEAAHRISFTDVEVEALRRIVPGFPGGDEIALVGESVGSLSICGQDKGNAKEVTVPLVAGSTYRGPGCRFFVNRHYLLDALNAGFRNFMFADTVSPLVSSDGRGAMNVLMPLRMNHEKPIKVEGQPDTGAGGVAQQPADPAQAQQPVTPKPAEASQAEKPSQASQPSRATQKQETSQQQPEKEKEMKQEKQTTPQAPVTTTEPATPTALERAQAAYEKTKACLRDMQASLADMAADLRDAVREDRQRKTDADGIRSVLAKIQTMKV